MGSKPARTRSDGRTAMPGIIREAGTDNTNAPSGSRATQSGSSSAY